MEHRDWSHLQICSRSEKSIEQLFRKQNYIKEIRSSSLELKTLNMIESFVDVLEEDVRMAKLNNMKYLKRQTTT